MTTPDAEPDWQIENDTEFAQWYRQQRLKPAFLIILGVLGFLLDLVTLQAGIGTLIGLVLIAIAFGNTKWKDHNLRDTYTCRNCAAKLQSSESDHANEISYACSDCHIEYRVQI